MCRFKPSHLKHQRALSIDPIKHIVFLTISRRGYQGIGAVAGTLRIEAIAAVDVRNDVSDSI
jgi:hypothetical protein